MKTTQVLWVVFLLLTNLNGFGVDLSDPLLPGQSPKRPNVDLLDGPVPTMPGPKSTIPVREISLSQIITDGKTTLHSISREQAEKLPAWDPFSDTPAPISLSKALAKAKNWLNKKHSSTEAFALDHFEISKIRSVGLENRYFYFFHFLRSDYRNEHLTGYTWFYVLVLLDGTIVEPIIKDAEKEIAKKQAGRDRSEVPDPHSFLPITATKADLIGRSSFIAVVELSGVPSLKMDNDASLSGMALPTQRGKAKVLQSIRGDLPHEILIENEANSILTNGKKLAFLKASNDEHCFVLSAPNALHTIEGDQVSWFSGNLSLKVVIDEIKDAVEKKKH